MKVVTLNEERYEACVSRLADCVRDSGFSPDIVVGIASGGLRIAADMAQLLGLDESYKLTARRPSTAKKAGWKMHILRLLPTPVLDFLRIVEAKMLARRVKKAAPKIDVDIDNSLEGRLKSSAERILVVDDAIDSGYTAASVVARLRELALDAEIRLAVITVTTDNPVIAADYYIYNDKTLLRFPWSKDAKH